MCDTVVAEGAGKVRDGKKWKSRWLVLRKPSPVADCLVLYVYKERGVKERSSVTLENICGLETHVCGDGVSFTLSILCLTQTTVLGFDIREAIQSWDLRLRYCLGEVHSFSVSVLPGTKLESGPATLHLCNSLLVIAKDQPPVIAGHWNLLELRRYGPVSNGFVFEGGTRCGSWAGVFFLSCSEGEQISFLFDCIVRGICPSRGPFGIKPLLPECGVGAVSVQDRLKHEEEELERRLSMLSHSTASSSSVGSSVTGDACSISGSSDTSDASQSDCSASSRPALWTESTLPCSSGRSLPPASKTASQGSESLSDSLSVSANLTDRPRKLKDTGRQNSSDSGIATGSHSSYTGSFSSYSGSLDAAGPEDECGTLLNLPPPAYPEKRLCTCPPSPAHEYQVPLSLRYLYDTPRRLLEDTRMSECSLDRTRSSDTFPDSGQCELMLELNRGEGLKKGEGLHGASCSKSYGDCGICSTAGPKSLFTSCPACGGLKGTHLPVMTSLSTVPVPIGFESRRPSHSAHSLLYENCLHCRRGENSCHLPKPTPLSRSQEHFLQDQSEEEFFSFSAEYLRMSLQQMHEEGKRAEKGKRPDSAYEIMESRATERCSESEKSRYELMGGCAGSRGSNHLTEGGLFAFPLDGLARGDLVTYVNIPISPMSKKQLNYMEVELQEASAAVRGRSSSKYAQIDITATEAAHRAGTQHALGREEGLQRLEQRRRGGAPQ